MTNVTFDLVHYDSVGSTNDEARHLAETGAAHGTVVVAREQMAGRGRRGRRWVSPPGNLYVSILLRVGLPALRMAELGFVAALAVADAVETLAPSRVLLKWPNDVLVDGAKLSGILLESVDQAVIVGIGVNVAHAPPDTPYPVTALNRIAGQAVTVEATLDALLDAFARWVVQWQRDGFAVVRDAWMKCAHPVGTSLQVTIGAQCFAGRFAGLSETGALLLDTDDGRRELLAGDVVVGGNAP